MVTAGPEGVRRLPQFQLFHRHPMESNIQALLINVATISDGMLSKNMVTHHYMQVNVITSSNEGKEKLYLFQGPSSLLHPSTKTRNNKFLHEYIICHLMGIYRPPLSTSLSPSLPQNKYSFISITLVAIFPPLYMINRRWYYNY